MGIADGEWNGGDDIRHLELGTFNLFDEEFRIKTLSNAILVPYEDHSSKAFLSFFTHPIVHRMEVSTT